MICIFYLLSLFSICIKADMPITIPCVNDETCKSVLNPSLHFKCLNGGCMCANETNRSYQICSTGDIIVSARQRAGLRRDCSRDVDCEHIDGAKCYDLDASKGESRRVCDCQPHMVMSADDNKCLPGANEIGARCVESHQCTAKLEGAECNEGRCKCRPTFHFADTMKRCVLNKVYGESCVREEESCFQSSGPDGKNVLGCSNKNICRCIRNYVYIDGSCQHSGASRVIFNTSLLAMLIMLSTRLF